MFLTLFGFQNYKVGRIKQHRLGSYVSVGKDSGLFPDKDEVMFYIVETIERGEDMIERLVTSMVPTHWLSHDLKYLLYPRPSKKKSDNPVNWNKSVYKRKVFPESQWMEYNVERVVNLDDKRKSFQLLSLHVLFNIFMRNFESRTLSSSFKTIEGNSKRKEIEWHK